MNAEVFTRALLSLIALLLFVNMLGTFRTARILQDVGAKLQEGVDLVHVVNWPDCDGKFVAVEDSFWWYEGRLQRVPDGTGEIFLECQ